MSQIFCGNFRFGYCKKCDCVTKLDESVGLLPIDMSLQTRFLSSEYVRTQEETERFQGVFASVREIYDKKHSVFFVLLE